MQVKRIARGAGMPRGLKINYKPNEHLNLRTAHIYVYIIVHSTVVRSTAEIWEGRACSFDYLPS